MQQPEARSAILDQEKEIERLLFMFENSESRTARVLHGSRIQARSQSGIAESGCAPRPPPEKFGRRRKNFPVSREITNQGLQIEEKVALVEEGQDNDFDCVFLELMKPTSDDIIAELSKLTKE